MGPCLCGDPYCSSCGPAQGYTKCEHGAIEGDCGVVDCEHFLADAEPCCVCGKESKGYFQGRPDFPWCGDMDCRTTMLSDLKWEE